LLCIDSRRQGSRIGLQDRLEITRCRPSAHSSLHDHGLAGTALFDKQTVPFTDGHTRTPHGKDWISARSKVTDTHIDFNNIFIPPANISSEPSCSSRLYTSLTRIKLVLCITRIQFDNYRRPVDTLTPPSLSDCTRDIYNESKSIPQVG
jgi:hypothetical protein